MDTSYDNSTDGHTMLCDYTTGAELRLATRTERDASERARVAGAGHGDPGVITVESTWDGEHFTARACYVATS